MVGGSETIACPASKLRLTGVLRLGVPLNILITISTVHGLTSGRFCLFLQAIAKEVECLFIYVGLTCLYERHHISVLDEKLKILSVSKAKEILSKQFIEMIESESTKLKVKLVISKPKAKSTNIPEFIRLGQGLFIYCHGFYSTMSSTTTTSLLRCGVSISISDGDLSPCCIESHDHHDGLLPFFLSNGSLLRHYKKVIEDPLQGDARKRELKHYNSDLQLIMAGTKKRVNTCFHCSSLPSSSSWLLKEDEWTSRLYHSLDKYLPKHTTVRCSFAEGKWFSGLQQCYSQALCANMHIFHGAPDLVITTKKWQVDLNEEDEEDSVIDVVNCYTVESDSDSSDAGVIEVARASVPVAPVSLIPEKVGQVAAAMHFLSLSKMVRNLIKRKRLLRVVKTKGILLDKSNGAIECVMTMHPSLPSSPANLEISCIDRCGQLSASNLCQVLQKLY